MIATTTTRSPSTGSKSLLTREQRKIKIENAERETKEHSVRVEAGNGVIQRHGIYQSRIPIRAGLAVSRLSLDQDN